MIVVDSSVALKWIVEEDESDLAQGLYATHFAPGHGVSAPPLLPIEVCNALRQRVRRAGVPDREALAALDRLSLVPFRVVPLSLDGLIELGHRALELASAFDLGATYDAHYIALAEGLGCDLWTADARLVRSLDGRLPYVRLLSTFVPEGDAPQIGSQ